MSTKILAYKAHPALTRPVFLRELRLHEKLDRYVKGSYATCEDPKHFRGCAVGCALETVRRKTKIANIGKSDHGAYEKFLGIPVRLAFVEDKIFEGLPIKEAKKWPLRFATAAKEGADLSGVYAKFQIWLMRDELIPLIGNDKWGVSKACELVAKAWEDNGDFTAAGAAAEAAAGASWSAGAAAGSAWAAEAAARSAWAAAGAAAGSAAGASWSAWAAARASWSAWSARGARGAAYRRQANKLIELMSAA